MTNLFYMNLEGLVYFLIITLVIRFIIKKIKGVIYEKGKYARG